jgi:hypothetical protein
MIVPGEGHALTLVVILGCNSNSFSSRSVSLRACQPRA